MAIKAVFFDIDGTLLNDKKRVEKTTILAIKQLKEQGIFVGVATGRGPSFVQDYLENLNLDFAVSYNGQYIHTRDKVLYQNPLKKNLVREVLRYASNKNREVSLGTVSGLVGSQLIAIGTSTFGQIVSRLVPKHFSTSIKDSFKLLYRRFKPQNIEYLKEILTKPIFQIVLVATVNESQKFKKQFPKLTITRSSPYSIDLISKGQSKIKGIQRLGKLFDFSLDEVMAFGDSENDLDMLSSVKIGIAMENGHDNVKSIASYTTDSNNRDGIAKALSHHGLIHFEPIAGFKSRDDNFNKVKDFHLKMDGSINYNPKLYKIDEASHRANFKIEELVEFLYAASQKDKEQFQFAISNLHEAIDNAVKKVTSKPHSETPLVGEVDALTDLLYFTYGSFVLMGVDPKPFFEIVHEANMNKFFPDGKAHFDQKTHKILKPDNWEKDFAPEPAIRKELNRQLQKSLQHANK